MEPEKPIISIICALHNDARFIRETLDTIVSQTFRDWELIIMDGISTDGTVDIVKEYAAKYPNIIWRSEPDKGQWDALDKALALTRGEYLFMMCGQDGYLDKDWFSLCVKTFQEHPEVSLVWGIPFNMSEDSKLTGPHYAYASFLKDKRYGSQTKPISTAIAKIDWRRPDAWRRLLRFLGKLTPSRIMAVLRSFRKEELPEKEDWFFYWLRTACAFPEGNMCIRKEVYVKNTVRFPQESMMNVVLFDFSFNFNSRGYLAYGLPIAAGFGRSHVGSQTLGGRDAEMAARYRKQVADFREKVKKMKTFKFIDTAGNVVSERPINL
jgi:glycosyltransferase involved in cell wall biosynthesis